MTENKCPFLTEGGRNYTKKSFITLAISGNVINTFFATSGEFHCEID